jgi:predicted branched-subunit amino acid permease
MRYLLMSAALSQRFSPETPLIHRALVGFGITDEIFGLGIARPEWIVPAYMYSAFLLAELFWSSGTAIGIVAGNILPASVVSALSVAIYGMFLAIIIPPARKERIVGVLVLVSFVCSYGFSVLPAVSSLSDGMKTILLTVTISAAAAALFPIRDDEGGKPT